MSDPGSTTSKLQRISVQSVQYYYICVEKNPFHECRFWLYGCCCFIITYPVSIRPVTFQSLSFQQPQSRTTQCESPLGITHRYHTKLLLPPQMVHVECLLALQTGCVKWPFLLSGLFIGFIFDFLESMCPPKASISCLFVPIYMMQSIQQKNVTFQGHQVGHDLFRIGYNKGHGVNTVLGQGQKRILLLTLCDCKLFPILLFNQDIK